MKVPRWFRAAPRAEQPPDGPQGVRIVHADGRVSECAVVRDPEDKDGCAQWIAEPPPGTIYDPARDRMQCDRLPGRTALTIAARIGFTCPRCGMTSPNLSDVARGHCGACGWTG